MFLFIGLFIFILVIAIFLCANVLYDLALNPHFDKSRIFGSGEKPEEESWPANIFDGEAEAEDVWITSCDGLRLHGLCARQKTDSSASLQDSPCRQEKQKRDWVIGIHGYTGDAAKWVFVRAPFTGTVITCFFRITGVTEKARAIMSGWGGTIVWIFWPGSIIW